MMLRYLLIAAASAWCLSAVSAAADKPAAPKPDGYALGQSAFQAKDYDKARALWLPLAEGGDVRSQYAIGRLYEKGHGVGRDFETAVTWYRRAAEQGHADSQYRLAVGYAYGLGIKKDESLALAWLRKAANLGQKRAQKVLARAYQDGRLGLAADPELAQYWYDKAESGSKR